VITDQNGNRKEQMEYFPFGTYRAFGIPTGTYDFDANFPDVFYTFTGQEEDDELGLYNFKARLYDPVIGRFISADTIVPNPENPQSLNRYSYCLNNPLRYIDPTGNQEADPNDPNDPGVTGIGGIFNPDDPDSNPDEDNIIIVPPEENPPILVAQLHPVDEWFFFNDDENSKAKIDVIFQNLVVQPAKVLAEHTLDNLLSLFFNMEFTNVNLEAIFNFFAEPTPAQANPSPGVR